MMRYADAFNIQVLHENLKNVIEKHHPEKELRVITRLKILNTPDYTIGIKENSFVIRSNSMISDGGKLVKRFADPEFRNSVHTYLQNNAIVIRNRVLLDSMLVKTYLCGDIKVLLTPIYYENCIFLRYEQSDYIKNYCKNCEFV